MVWMTQQVLKEYKNNAEHTQFKVKMDSKNLDQKLPRLTRELERARQNERMSEHINYNVKRKNLCRPVNCGITYDCKYCHCLTQISRCTSIDARSGSRSNKYDCKWKKYSPCESVNLPNRFWFKVLIHVLNIIYLKQ